MPAPRRAILTNIHEQNLDPKKAYSKTNKTGKLFEENSLQTDKVEKENKSTVFASLNIHDKVLKIDKQKDETLLVEKQNEELHTSKVVEELVELTSEIKEVQQEKTEITQSFNMKKKQKRKNN